MRKKFSALIFIALILGSTFSPVFGVGKAKADDYADMSHVFPAANTPIDSYNWLVNPDNLELVGPVDAPGSLSSTGAKLKLNVKITSTDSVQEINPHDMNGNGYLDSGDADYAGGENNFGGWDSILDDNAEASSANGLFLVIGTGDILNTLPEDSNIGGRINPDGIVDNFTINDPDDPTKPVVYKFGGDFPNVGYYVFQKSAVAMFPLPHEAGKLGNAQVDNIAIPVGNLQPNTTYHARIMLVEDVVIGDPARAVSNIVTFTTKPEGTTGATDPITLDEGDTASGTQTGEQQKALFGELIECDALDFYTWGGCFVYFFYTIIYHASHFLLQMAGLLFDFFIGFSLSSKVYGQTTFVYDGWKIVRDISNIFFIFILMYAAIGMILKLHHFDAKKIIAKVIIIGLLINFSLFFTRVVIDASNVLARVFYNEINISNTEDLGVADPAKTGLVTKGLSSGIVEGMNIANILSDEENFNKIKNSGEIGSGTIFLIVLIGLIVNLITAWTFITVCMYFVGRILGLWFAMIFAPMAFVTNIVPGLGSKLPQVGWGSWVSNLTNLAIMAPIFVFFMYLIMAFLKVDFIGDMLLSNNANFTLAEFLVTIILRFMLIIGLIKSAQGLAEKLSGEFGKAVAGAAKAVVGATALVAGGAVGLAAGGVAALGARTVGARSAAYLGSAEGKTMKLAAAGDRTKIGELKKLDKYKGWSDEKIQKMAEDKVKTKQKMASASFDVRNTGLANSISKATGVDMNAIARVPGMKAFGVERTTGGFQGEADRRGAKRKKFFDSLSLSEDEKKELESGIKDKDKEIKRKEADIKDTEKPFTDKIDDLKKEKEKLVELAQASGKKGLSSADTSRLKAIQNSITDQEKARSAALKPDKDELKKMNADKNKMEDDYKEKSKSAFRKYSEFVADKNNKVKDATGNGALTSDSVRKAFSRSVGEGFRQMGKNTGAAIKEGLAGAGLGTLVAGPIGTVSVGLAGFLNGLQGGGVMRGAGRVADLGIESTATHNIEHGHVHEPHDKPVYKSPNVKIFNMFKGFSLGGGGGGGGGGADHGGGHDDHGGGGHH